MIEDLTELIEQTANGDFSASWRLAERAPVDRMAKALIRSREELQAVVDTADEETSRAAEAALAEIWGE